MTIMQMALRGALMALALALAPAAAQAPGALDRFEPGRWQVQPIGGGSPTAQCVASASAFITGGRTAGCRINPVSRSADRLVATWQCEGASGRTAIRRDADGLYTIDIQGIDGGLPFAATAEWRRTGGC